MNITRRPPSVQRASSRPIGSSLNLCLHSLRLRTGSSRHAITLPKTRSGTSTKIVPLRYQPTTGDIPKPSRNHGTTSSTASHKSTEKSPYTVAVARNPTGGGMACVSVGIIGISINSQQVFRFPYLSEYRQDSGGSFFRCLLLEGLFYLCHVRAFSGSLIK